MPSRLILSSGERSPLTAIALAVVGVVSLGACTAGPRVGTMTAPSTHVVDPNAIVVGIVDGDTIDVDILGSGRRERTRLIGIDTPETVRPDTPVECFGPEASAFTTALLPAGTAVRLERDVEPRDAFGRLLAYVYRADDGLFVNEALVAGGFARPLPFEPNTSFAALLADAARDAQARSLGLWGSCSG
jgi:micrococcal nuclease